MKKTVFAVSLIFIFIVFVNQPMAEMYKWVDKDGVVHFSDTPPRTEKNVEVRETTNYTPPPPNKTPNNTQNDAKNRFSADTETDLKRKAKAQRNNTVEIYTTSWCRYCKDAIAFLKSNKIKYKEYDVEQDSAAAAKMRALGGRGVPFAIINNKIMSGFSKKIYKRALGLR